MSAADIQAELAQAEAHEQAGRLDEAEAVLAGILAKAPRNARAVHAQGIIAARRNDIEGAARLMEQSLKLGPAPPFFHRNLCEIYRQLGRLDEALAAGEKAASANPNDFLAHVNLAVLHYARGDPDASIASARLALALRDDAPGAHFALAEAHLLKGELAEGWEEYEWRFRMPGVPALVPQGAPPLWNGKPLKDPLILVADQGFGDGVQFARYIPWAAERCGEVVLACSPELRPLIGDLAGVGRVIIRWEDCPKAAAHCPLSGLPRLHRTRVATIPAPIPYLAPAPERVDRWRSRLDQLAAPGHRRVGLAWAGRPTHKNDANRSLRLAQLAPLGEVAGVTFVALQKGGAEAQVGDWFAAAPLVNLGPELADFADTAAVLAGLDLTVSVDTSIIHVAGALGRPVWMLTPWVSDWRWLQKRPDSPWYPTLRLFRQETRGAWAPVVERVAAALAADE